MFLAHQPTHMGKEETTTRIMGIRISIGKFVMNTMITTPLVYAVLKRERLTQHKENAQWQSSFVGTMRPEAMYTGCNTQTSEYGIQVAYEREETGRRKQTNVINE